MGGRSLPRTHDELEQSSAGVWSLLGPEGQKNEGLELRA